jgi:hypothetical protein
MQDRLKGARLIATAAVGFVALGSPLLSVADSDERVLGVPVLYAYLFGVWALVIALVALAVRLSHRGGA